jgi:hypothetical protein
MKSALQAYLPLPWCADELQVQINGGNQRWTETSDSEGQNKSFLLLSWFLTAMESWLTNTLWATVALSSSPQARHQTIRGGPCIPDLAVIVQTRQLKTCLCGLTCGFPLNHHKESSYLQLSISFWLLEDPGASSDTTITTVTKTARFAPLFWKWQYKIYLAFTFGSYYWAPKTFGSPWMLGSPTWTSPPVHFLWLFWRWGSPELFAWASLQPTTSWSQPPK